MKMQVNEECIGCGLCPEICPDVFKMQETGFAEAIDEDISEQVEESAEEAMESCPVSAIEIAEE